MIGAERGTGAWSESGYRKLTRADWSDALEAAGLPYQRPYDLRHSFASLLLHEGCSVIYVARQLGHAPAVLMETSGHVIDGARRGTADRR